MNLFGGTEIGPRNSRIFLVPLTVVLLSDSQFSKKNASTARRHEENYFLT